MTDIDAIRRRHEAHNEARRFGDNVRQDYEMLATRAHADRATLLRLLDAARAELDAEQVAHLKTYARLTEMKRAAGVITGRKWVELISSELPDYQSISIDIRLDDLRRLAAALKEPSHD